MPEVLEEHGVEISLSAAATVGGACPLRRLLGVGDDEGQGVRDPLEEARHAQGLDRQLDLSVVRGEAEDELRSVLVAVGSHRHHVGGVELLLHQVECGLARPGDHRRV